MNADVPFREKYVALRSKRALQRAGRSSAILSVSPLGRSEIFP